LPYSWVAERLENAVSSIGARVRVRVRMRIGVRLRISVRE
jgi:hypothetical protein